MSNQSKACEFTNKVRQEIYERDNNSCIMPDCMNPFGLGIAHIFKSRAKGGLGVAQNGVTLCQHHHGLLDNGRSAAQAEYIDRYCKEYLKQHYGTIKMEDITYDKWKGLHAWKSE